MSGAAAACVVALKVFTWPHLEGWRGLAARCNLAELKQVLQVADDVPRGSGYIGDDRTQLSWLSAAGAGFPNPIRVWLDGDQVVLLETPIFGKAADFDALARKLGEPAAKLDAFSGHVLVAKSEWVYPDRGLTLFVEPDNHVPLHVAAYRPTTLEDYRKRLRPITSRPRRLRLHPSSN
jgi:hypothetical protein